MVLILFHLQNFIALPQSIKILFNLKIEISEKQLSAIHENLELR